MWQTDAELSARVTGFARFVAFGVQQAEDEVAAFNSTIEVLPEHSNRQFDILLNDLDLLEINACGSFGSISV